MRRLDRFKAESKENTLVRWYKRQNPLKIMRNYMLLGLSNVLVFPSIKRLLWRLCGAKVGKNVIIGPRVGMDFFFPELITIGDNCIIGFQATILAHEFLMDEWRRGKVEIGKNVVIGTGATILPGVKIGDKAIIGAKALVMDNVPAGQTWVGVPARKLR